MNKHQVEVPPRNKHLVDRLEAFLLRIEEFLQLNTPISHLIGGADWAVAISVLMLNTLVQTDLNSGFGLVIDLLISGILAGLLYLLGTRLLTWLLNYIYQPTAKPFAIGIVGTLFWVTYSDLPESIVVWPSIGMVLIQMLFGSTASWIFKPHLSTTKRSTQWIVSGFFVVSLSFNILLGLWLFWPGEESVVFQQENANRLTPILAAPLEEGEYPVFMLSYGSGTDLRRPIYAEEASLITPTVNTSTFFYNPHPKREDFVDWLRDPLSKEFPLGDWFEAELRNLYWGFDRTAMPLNAVVWYPDGPGPFPLVLVVHGNHDMTEASEFGYEYLGRHLASKGYIVASIDENFLNGYFAGGISGENDARGWLLLKHLEQWDQWQKTPGNPFYSKVAMDQIALVGHSRGGEAVTIAAAFNQLAVYPDNGNRKLDFKYNIQSVVAIAPVDEQYQPADHPLPLTDINYLVLQGGQDGDVYSFTGLRQYQRVQFSPSDQVKIKIAIYLYQANHSQFNSDWGSMDLSLPRGFYLNRANLFSPDTQQQLATAVISAFLDTTLKRVIQPLKLQQNLDQTYSNLPLATYIQQFESSRFMTLASFEEDIDLLTGSREGVELKAFGTSRWKEIMLEYRNGQSQENHVVSLAWGSGGGDFTIRLNADLVNEVILNTKSYLVFNALDPRLKPGEEIKLGIELVDAFGNRAYLPANELVNIPIQLPVQFSKIPAWEVLKFKKPTEPILGTIRLPLSNFLHQNPDLILSDLRVLKFVFPVGAVGELYLDQIGFEP